MSEKNIKHKLLFSERVKQSYNRGDISVWLMMFPAILMLVVVSVYPFIWIFKYVAYDYNGFVAYFVGFDNFKRVLTDTQFWGSVVHTFEYAILKLVFILPLALASSGIVESEIKGKQLFSRDFFLADCNQCGYI